MQALKKCVMAGFVLMAGVLPAQAFDCGKAQSVVEKAICGDAKLRSADDAMGSVYAALRGKLTGVEREALAASQRKWVKSREDNCGYRQGTELSDCILSQTEERRLLLVAAPESGPGSGSPMMPVFIQQDPDPYHFDVDCTLIRFVKPKSRGETAFNVQVNKIAERARLGRQKEAARDGQTYSNYAAMTLTYASPHFLSAMLDSSEYSGGAHGNSWTAAINVALARGAVMKASDLFDAKGQAALKADCIQQIFAQKKERNGGRDFNPEEDPNYQEQTIVDHLKVMSRWSFWKDKAVVTFVSYRIGSYAEGPYECTFAMAKLKSLAKPGALLPE